LTISLKPCLQIGSLGISSSSYGFEEECTIQSMTVGKEEIFLNSFYEASITTQLLKQDKDIKNRENCRPISLMKIDAKNLKNNISKPNI
jgi:hypothetical protein